MEEEAAQADAEYQAAQLRFEQYTGSLRQRRKHRGPSDLADVPPAVVFVIYFWCARCDAFEAAMLLARSSWARWLEAVPEAERSTLLEDLDITRAAFGPKIQMER